MRTTHSKFILSQPPRMKARVHARTVRGADTIVVCCFPPVLSRCEHKIVDCIMAYTNDNIACGSDKYMFDAMVAEGEGTVGRVLFCLGGVGRDACLVTYTFVRKQAMTRGCCRSLRQVTAEATKTPRAKW